MSRNKVLKHIYNCEISDDNLYKIYTIFGIKIKLKCDLKFKRDLDKNKKHILLISHELSITGAPLMLYEIAKILHNSNYDVKILSTCDGNLYETIKNDSNFDLIIIKRNISKFKKKLIKLMISFDLVIINTIISDYFAKLCAKNKIPYIWLLHEAKNIDVFRPDYNKIQKTFKKCEGHIYTVSDYAKNHLLNKYKTESNVINNFVKDEYRGSHIKPGEKIKFTFLGTIDENKGLEYLCPAFVQLDKSIADKCELNIYGKAGCENYYNKIKDICNSICNVHFHQTVIGEERLNVFENTNVFIIPSLEESSSMVLLEACMIARPAIVTENVGAKYMITPQTGWIVKPKSVEAIKDCITQIVQNPENLDTMGQAAREKYLETSTKEIYTKNLLETVNKYIK